VGTSAQTRVRFSLATPQTTGEAAPAAETASVAAEAGAEDGAAAMRTTSRREGSGVTSRSEGGDEADEWSPPSSDRSCGTSLSKRKREERVRGRKDILHLRVD